MSKIFSHKQGKILKMFCFSNSSPKVNRKSRGVVFKSPLKLQPFFTVHYCKRLGPVVSKCVSQRNWQTN